MFFVGFPPEKREKILYNNLYKFLRGGTAWQQAQIGKPGNSAGKNSSVREKRSSARC
jgi:hypothetical protein